MDEIPGWSVPIVKERLTLATGMLKARGLSRCFGQALQFR
jgi:hypothetical protein